MAAQFVIVKLELGHKASYRTHVSPKGFTHDWSVYVRGADGADIQHFVDKVIFRLHETFERHTQVRKEPPYAISESGYASFELRVDIHFKNDEEPNMISYVYDLYLPAQGSPPVKHYRQEKLTFKNPPDEFRKRLIQGGGIATDNPSSLSVAPAPSASTSSTSNASSGGDSVKQSSKSSKPSGSTPGKELRGSSSAEGDAKASVSSASKGEQRAPEKKQLQTAAKGGVTDDAHKSSDKRHSAASEAKDSDKVNDRKEGSKSSKKSAKEVDKSVGAKNNLKPDSEKEKPQLAEKGKDKGKDKDTATKPQSKLSGKESSSTKSKDAGKAPGDYAEKSSAEKLPKEDARPAGSKVTAEVPAPEKLRDVSSDRPKSGAAADRSKDSVTEKPKDSAAEKTKDVSEKVKDVVEKSKSSNADRRGDAGDKSKAALSGTERAKSDVASKDASSRTDKVSAPYAEKSKAQPPGGSGSDHSSSKSSSGSRSSKPAPHETKQRGLSDDRRVEKPPRPTVDKGPDVKKSKTEAGGQKAASAVALLGLSDSSSSDESSQAPSPALPAASASAATVKSSMPPAKGSTSSKAPQSATSVRPVAEPEKPKADISGGGGGGPPPGSKSKSPTKGAAQTPAQPESDDRAKRAASKTIHAVSESPSHKPASAKRAAGGRPNDDDDMYDSSEVSSQEPPTKIRHFSDDLGSSDEKSSAPRGLTPNVALAAPLVAAEVPEVPAAATMASAAAAAALAGRGHQRAPNGVLVGELLGLHEKIRLLTDRLLVQKVVDIIEDTGMYKITDKSFDFDLCLLDLGTIKKLEQCFM